MYQVTDVVLVCAVRDTDKCQNAVCVCTHTTRNLWISTEESAGVIRHIVESQFYNNYDEKPTTEIYCHISHMSSLLRKEVTFFYDFQKKKNNL